MKILFTGGGTGGHIFPIFAVLREMRKAWQENPSFQKEELHFFYLGPKDKYYTDLFFQEGVRVSFIIVGKLRRYFSFQNFIDILFRIPVGFVQSFFHIALLSPDLIFSKGGYGSLPVVFWAKVFGIPIFLHESDVSPGLANKILSKFALEIFTSFPNTEYFPPSKIVQVGNPIRSELFKFTTQEGKRILNLKLNPPVILILGGSQGSQRINDLILGILPELSKSYQIIHQAGQKNFKQVEAEANVVLSAQYKENYHLFPFLEEPKIYQVYQAADLVVARAGSGIIFELAATGKPSIVIPLTGAAQNHQVKNAYSYAKTGASIVLEEANLTPHFFLEKLNYLFSHSQELQKMREQALKFSSPKAAKIIAEYLLTFLTQ